MAVGARTSGLAPPTGTRLCVSAWPCWPAPGWRCRVGAPRARHVGQPAPCADMLRARLWCACARVCVNEGPHSKLTPSCRSRATPSKRWPLPLHSRVVRSQTLPTSRVSEAEAATLLTHTCTHAHTPILQALQPHQREQRPGVLQAPGQDLRRGLPYASCILPFTPRTLLPPASTTLPLV